jgi:hypothetical protein
MAETARPASERSSTVNQPGGWKTLAEGERGVVLALDFDATGRIEARFTDLVANLAAGGYSVWESVQPDPVVAERGGDALRAHWMRRLLDEDPEVLAIFGYCAGAVYAAALTDWLAAVRGVRVPLVLFDPETVDADGLLFEFKRAVGFLAGTIPEPEIDVFNETATRIRARHVDVRPLCDELLDLVRDVGAPALDRAGLPEAIRDELIGIIRSFMRYLTAAAEIDPWEQWSTAVVFTSNSPLSGLNALRATRPAGPRIEVQREIMVDVDNNGILADPSVARAVDELLARGKRSP